MVEILRQQAACARGLHQNLDRRHHALAVGARHQPLRDDGPERAGQHCDCRGLANRDLHHHHEWGVILDLSDQGLSMRGVDVAAFEDLVAMIKAGDEFTSGVVFFPMHRIERIELDLPEGSIHSLAERFRAKTSRDASTILSTEALAPEKNRR